MIEFTVGFERRPSRWRWGIQGWRAARSSWLGWIDLGPFYAWIAVG